MLISDPARASKETHARQAAEHSEDARKKESNRQRVRRQRTELVRNLVSAVEIGIEVDRLAGSDGAVVGGMFGDAETYRRVKALVDRLQQLVLNNPYRNPGGGPDGEDDSGDAINQIFPVTAPTRRRREMARAEPPSPERDQRTLGSLKKSFCAWLLHPERLKHRGLLATVAVWWLSGHPDMAELLNNLLGLFGL